MGCRGWGDIQAGRHLPHPHTETDFRDAQANDFAGGIFRPVIAAGKRVSPLPPAAGSRRAAFPHRAPIKGRTRSRLWTPLIRRFAASWTCRSRVLSPGTCVAAYLPSDRPPSLRHLRRWLPPVLFEASSIIRSRPNSSPLPQRFRLLDFPSCEKVYTPLRVFRLSHQSKPEHLVRKAIVYLRQSSDRQVRQNKESQLLQYAVAERMRALGWAQVEAINSDLGSSAGIAATQREGFERVLSLVA